MHQSSVVDGRVVFQSEEEFLQIMEATFAEQRKHWHMCWCSSTVFLGKESYDAHRKSAAHVTNLKEEVIKRVPRVKVKPNNDKDLQAVPAPPEAESSCELDGGTSRNSDSGISNTSDIINGERVDVPDFETISSEDSGDCGIAEKLAPARAEEKDCSANSLLPAGTPYDATSDALAPIPKSITDKDSDEPKQFLCVVIEAQAVVNKVQDCPGEGFAPTSSSEHGNPTAEEECDQPSFYSEEFEGMPVLDSEVFGPSSITPPCPTPSMSSLTDQAPAGTKEVEKNESSSYPPCSKSHPEHRSGFPEEDWEPQPQNEYQERTPRKRRRRYLLCKLCDIYYKGLKRLRRHITQTHEGVDATLVSRKNFAIYDLEICQGLRPLPEDCRTDESDDQSESDEEMDILG